MVLYDVMCGYEKRIQITNKNKYTFWRVLSLKNIQSCCQFQNCCSGTFPFEQPNPLREMRRKHHFIIFSPALGLLIYLVYKNVHYLYWPCMLIITLDFKWLLTNSQIKSVIKENLLSFIKFIQRCPHRLTKGQYFK